MDNDTVELESPSEVNALSDRQVRNRTLHMIGLQTVALQTIADSVERIASGIEALASIEPVAIKIATGDGTGEPLPPISCDADIAGRMWDQKGPS
jgi:hypothetical protein